MTDDFSSYEMQSVDIATLQELPYRIQVSPNIVMFNTNDNSRLNDILHEARGRDARVEFMVHDAESNLLIRVGDNPGHAPGFNPDYVLSESGGNVTAFLEGFVLEEVGEIVPDWVTVNMIEHWRVNE